MRSLLIVSLLMQLGREQSPAMREFMKQTGYPKGRPGFVVDHKIPICLGGPDSIENMQWQEVQKSYQKDVFERALCKEVKKRHYKLVKE